MKINQSNSNLKTSAQQLGQMPIKPLIWKLSVPAIVGMMVMALYNIVDTIFVGQGVGPLAIGGLAVVMPIHMIINSIAQTLGMGGASIISRSLGASNMKTANRTLGNLIMLVIVLGIVLTPLSYLFMDELLFAFGATGKIFEYARDYFSVLLWSAPVLSMAMVLNSIIRAEGNAKVAMMSMIVSAIVNVILNPIFIFGFGWGIKGSAWATVISIWFTLIYVLVYFLRGKSSLTVHLSDMIPDWKIIKEAIGIGASSFMRMASGAVTVAIVNHFLMTHGGEIAISAYGVVNRVMMVAFMPLLGLSQGFTPVAGFSLGARNFGRMRESIKASMLFSTYMALGSFVLIFAFAPQIALAFSSDGDLLNQATYAMRIIAFSFPILGIQVIGASFFQAMGKIWPSLFLSLLRQVIILIPLLLILPNFIGLDGIWIAFPLADFLSVGITWYMMSHALSKYPHADEPKEQESPDKELQTAAKL